MELGDLVVAYYKTGVYIGRLFDRTESKCVVEILAVVRHPEQGDLHQPHRADVPSFHQRKALSFRERALVIPNQMQLWTGEVPETLDVQHYAQSLYAAWEYELLRMQSMADQAWANRAIEELRLLETEYMQSGMFPNR